MSKIEGIGNLFTHFSHEAVLNSSMSFVFGKVSSQKNDTLDSRTFSY